MFCNRIFAERSPSLTPLPVTSAAYTPRRAVHRELGVGSLPPGWTVSLVTSEGIKLGALYVPA